MTYDDPYDDSGGETPSAEELHAQAVEVAVRRLRIQDEARARRAVEKAADDPAPPFDAGLLGDILAEPPEPRMRVEGLVLWEASTLIVAQKKTGKTTLTLNLAKSLLTGEDFLGRFPVNRVVTGRIGILNYEVSKAQLARWANEHGIDPQRFYQVNLRGRRNPLARDDDRVLLAQLLREHQVETLIVDTFARAFTGDKVSDSGVVSSFLSSLGLFARAEAGVTDLVLTTHAGWQGERSRDSSALEDWPDSIITMVKDDEKRRFLRAEGRDVDVDEDRLDYDQDTRTLTMSGAGSRKETARTARDETKLPQLAVLVRRAAAQSPGSSLAQIEKAIRLMDDAPSFQSRDISRAAKRGEEHGFLRVIVEGPGKPKRVYPDTPSNPVQTPAMDRHPYPVQPPSLVDGVGGAGSPTPTLLDGVPTQEAS